MNKQDLNKKLAEWVGFHKISVDRTKIAGYLRLLSGIPLTKLNRYVRVKDKGD